MDIGQKKTLVHKWFEHLCQENGFQQTPVEELSSGSLTLVLQKSAFPSLTVSVIVPHHQLQTLSPRELTQNYLPVTGTRLIDEYGKELRSLRQAH